MKLQETKIVLFPTMKHKYHVEQATSKIVYPTT